MADPKAYFDIGEIIRSGCAVLTAVAAWKGYCLAVERWAFDSKRAEGERRSMVRELLLQNIDSQKIVADPTKERSAARAGVVIRLLMKQGYRYEEIMEVYRSVFSLNMKIQECYWNLHEAQIDMYLKENP